MKTKINFSAKNAKSLRTNANKEHKGMNAAIKSVLAVWNGKEKDDELTASIKAAKADGLTAKDFSAQFIIENLTGTKWVNDGVILMNKKGTMVAKESWTAGAVVDYVRMANRARLSKESK